MPNILYNTGDPLFSAFGPSEGNSWEIPPAEDCSGPGLDCQIILHEANTGWWFAPDTINCQGDCPGAPSRPPVPLDCTLCEQAWIEEVSAQIGGLPTLGAVFPVWALDQAVIDPTLHFNIDGCAIVCGLNWITIPINLTRGGTKTCTPPLVLINGVCACPEGTSLSTGGDCVRTDPPIPAPLRNLSGGTFSLSPVLNGVPHPLAPDGIGFSRPSFPAPLPVHPVISQNSISAVCGDCEGALSGLESEEMEL